MSLGVGVVIARSTAHLQARTLPLRANRISGGVCVQLCRLAVAVVRASTVCVVSQRTSLQPPRPRSEK